MYGYYSQTIAQNQTSNIIKKTPTFAAPSAAYAELNSNRPDSPFPYRTGPDTLNFS